MKPKHVKLLLGLISLAPMSLFGQTVAKTTPVGYVSLGNAGSVPATTDVNISIPLLNSSIFAGTVSSVSGSTVNISGTPALGSLTATPHVLVVENNAGSGVIGLITANTSNSATLSLQSGQTIAGVVAGDKISIRPATTVLGLLGAALPIGTQLQAWSGSGAGIIVAPDLIFEWDGSNWVDTNTFDPADTTVVYPGEGFVLRSSTAITGLVVSGEVPVAKHNLSLYNASPGIGQDNMISFFSPVDEVIGDSGAGFTSGDQLLYWDNTTSGIIKAPQVLEYDGADWVDTNTFDPVTTTFTLQGGVSYMYRRSPSAPGTNQDWSNVQTYVPTL